MTTVALLLAAGFARRFGADKRQARLADGRGLLAASLANACEAFDEVCVVLRPEDDAAALGVPVDISIVRCAEAESGLGHSLAAGVAALADNPATSVAILLADMPWIAPQTLRLLASHASEQHIVFPLHQGQRGHPVLFGRAFWPELRALQGDEGARAVLQAHREAWQPIDVNDPGVLRDVDTPAALTPGSLLQGNGAGGAA
ncbi:MULTISPECIES: nucleotidyltransferase family protein [unclassified Pseudomonas]|uniref:nucleotidyltransferase family protein n=1 Tax=unclassified Pseudomonas TaxID=196821 RepID=UPI00072FEC1E|nr:MULTISPECIES: nucleotidyltransferase family protein [unclassified Pseudomonas]KSW25745.1 molybdopterin-guanine dinucleotide biosynthesis protein MobA [Pseudomonas sp. ADP]OBP11001.1 molybdopterin-guanine dinucleotide biosynthesis protein MobA [Pseudomonas sp. EGD-AKN5]QOF82341.1 nucleotidyltransferase family protein [Pseudomonas sp. ADPe]